MGARDQAGVIPFRRKRDAVEICLIRSKGQRKWKIPKGFVDTGETPPQAALKEAREEAGLRGRIVGQPLGSYKYTKWGLTLTVAVYLMEVTAQEDEWEESRFRERSWNSVKGAVSLLKRHPVEKLLDEAMAKLEKIRRR
jgi:8-oxo-dGTP pyrophosphatase MutT (NUDIX family)